MTIGRRHFLSTATAYGLSFDSHRAVYPDNDQEAPALNVRAFGARGDGVTDDTAAIQAAIETAEARFESFDYHGEGNTRAIVGNVYFPPGVYLTTGVVTRFASLSGAGPAVSFLKHQAIDDTSDLLTIGNGGQSHVSGVSVEGLGLVGDGNLTAVSGPGSANRTRANLYANNAIRKCFIKNVTSSQARIGILVEASWTLSLEDCYVFNCPRCVDWSGGHGSVKNCRFDATYNPRASSNDHAFILRYDHDDLTHTATMVFLSCAFQGAGLSGLLADDVMSCSFIGCLFERNNRSDVGVAYTHLASNRTRPPLRLYTFLDCLWTPAADEQTSSVALSIDAADSVQLLGCGFKDAGTPFAQSLTTGPACRSVLLQGSVDSTLNGPQFDESTVVITTDERGVTVGDSMLSSNSASVHGSLEVNRDGDSADTQLDLSGDAATRRIVRGLTNGSLRWAWGIMNDQETGSDAGSSWALSARSDEGEVVDFPIHVGRASSAPVTLARPLRLAVRTNQSRGQPGIAGRVIFNSDERVVQVDDGIEWVSL